MIQKQILTASLSLLLLLTACTGQTVAGTAVNQQNAAASLTSIPLSNEAAAPVKNSYASSSIPAPDAPLREIPNNYVREANQAGTVVRMDYRTASYTTPGDTQDKYAYVYLPYGYDENTPYNVLYLLHGGGGNAERYFEGENQSSAFKRILDHMIEEGGLKPLIVVTPTFYPMKNDDNSVSTASDLMKRFPQELVNDLLPAVEGRYSTYAKSTDADGLRTAREHRAFGGFSMGSVATWYTFAGALDYFKYFLPISGDSWAVAQQGGASYPEETASALMQALKSSGYSADDFLIYAVTGTRDIAFDAMSGQIEAMRAYPDSFRFTSNSASGNSCFRLKEGGTHDYPNVRQYLYNALPIFWSAADGETP